MSTTIVQLEPDLTDLLTDDQLADLGRIRVGLDKISELSEAVNSLILELCQPIRPVSEVSPALTGNDITVLMSKHNQAEERIRQAALAAAENFEELV